ncbi:MAG: glycosyltransferase, partial [Actinomycetota bacterium]
FAGISTVVAERINEAYGREADVIFPICDTDFFRPADSGLTDDGAVDVASIGGRLPDGEYVLSIGRFIPYKRHDIAIELAARLGLSAVVAGRGPDLPRLREVDRRCGGRTVFLDAPSREEIRTLYRRALFTVFPPIEDFGIVPVESLACGTPVLAVDAGGARDTVPATVGARSPSQELPDLLDSATKLLANLPDPGTCRDWAEHFSPTMFDKRIVDWVDRAMIAAAAGPHARLGERKPLL